MIFKRLFGRKNRRASPPEDQDGLIHIVRGDSDTEARRDACRRLKRLPELRELAFSDLDAGIRDIALVRYRKLLCGLEEDGPDLQECLEEIGLLEDQGILEAVALGGRAAEVRGAAIAKVESPDVLGSCALDDVLAANRSAAVERLEDGRALARVVKNIGKKDKHVYRAARQKRKEIAAREALPARIRAQCDELCEKVERLGRFGSWIQDRAMLDLLDRQWAEIEPEADPDRRVHYQDLRGRFLAAYEAYRSAHEAQIAAEESREAARAARRALLEELDVLSKAEDDVKMAGDLESIDARWRNLVPLPAKEQATFEREYGATRKQVAARLQALSATLRRNARLHELLACAEQVLERPKPLDRREIQTLAEEAESLLDAEGADKSIATRFVEVRKALGERLRKQKAHAEQRLDQLPEKLDELTSAVEGGALKDADPLYHSIAASLELIELSRLPRRAYADAAARLRTLMPRLRDLQQWRKWGTDQHRQELCIAMEQLVADDLSLEAMALRLHDLQMEWKGLDKGGSPLNHPLWERFHRASERVYEHCKPHLDEQAAERAANRWQRERLCQELETFLDQVDWERMEWKKAIRAELEMRRGWSAMGPVEGRHRKALEKRYRNAMKRLDKHLAEERGRNQAHKHELITQIEALAQEPDLGRAIEETKRLQKQWHTTVPARQKEENRLWQRFRAACDAVFARRREQDEAHATGLVGNLRRCEGLCAELESLAGSDAGVDELTAALVDLDGRWDDSEGLPVPRQAAPDLRKRWRTARSLVEVRCRRRLEEQRRKDLDLLADQAAVCERLERVLETEVGPDLTPAMIEGEWRSLPKQREPDLQAAIDERFGKALEALKQGGEKLQSLRNAIIANGEHRAELCLHLEILAGVESPPELTRERLQFQVTRLTEHMRDGERDPLEATSRLLQEWYLCGPAPAPQAPALEERFQRARRTIEEAERDDAAA